MGKILILNGSPRISKSNSKRYAELFIQYCHKRCDYFSILQSNHFQLRQKMEEYDDVLLVFPLYVDSLPVGLLAFLKYLEENPPQNKPVISILINCGFLEYQQNEVAVAMIRFFCQQCGYTLGSVLMLGGGEAILGTPFKLWAVWSIRKLARSVTNRNYRLFHTTMPLTKKLFLKASTRYWIKYGQKFGITKEQMETMQIE